MKKDEVERNEDDSHLIKLKEAFCLLTMAEREAFIAGVEAAYAPTVERYVHKRAL